jgi:hypothetical protein
MQRRLLSATVRAGMVGAFNWIGNFCVIFKLVCQLIDMSWITIWLLNFRQPQTENRRFISVFEVKPKNKNAEMLSDHIISEKFML